MDTNTVTVVGIDQVTAFLERRAGMSLDDLPNKYSVADRYDIPKTGRVVERRLESGKVIPHEETIADVNRDRYAYAWLDARELSGGDFSGYIPVKKGGAGAEHCPDRYFDTTGLIRAGEHTLCVCKKEYRDSMKSQIREPLARRMTRYHEVATSPSDANAGTSVKTTKYDTALVDPDALPEAQKRGLGLSSRKEK